jgi:DNA-binding MarR family transcriptional regulator
VDRGPEFVLGAKPATLRDYRSMLAAPGTRRRRVTGRAIGRIMAALGDAPAADVTTAAIESLLLSHARVGAHLERHRYVERVPDPADRCAKLVRPTTLGDEVYAVAREVLAELEDRLLRRLGAGARGGVRELLQMVDAELQRRVSDHRPSAR